MRRSALTSIALVTLTACGGGNAPTVQKPSSTTAKSYVAWPVSQGTVTAYRFDGVNRGAAVGTAQTDNSGAFQLLLNATSTDQLLLVVSSGSYTEVATGTPISVAGYELTALLPGATRLPGDAITGALISPVSHLVAQLSAYFVAHGTPPDAALSKANTLLNAHFGGIDWRMLPSPPDLSDASSGTVVQLNDAATAGLILAGLSMEARNLAQAKNLTPGGPLNSLSLLTAIAADIAPDHYFDGQGTTGLRLSVPSAAQNSYSLDGQTVRATLAQGISNFLSSSRNSSHVAQTDAQALITAIATDNNSQLFRDAGGSVDITPPSIVFVQPVANASVHGQVTVEAAATDETAMGSFTFSAPSALNATQATSEASGQTMRLKTILDVSALADGPLTISVAASDAASNTATENLTIRVANHGPVISVSSPNSGQIVKGTVAISATASGQNGATVTGLTLLGSPAGAGTDTLPAADSLAISWDSTQALEGPITLHFQATDSFGGVTDLFVPVTVDNVPFGVVTAHVSAGAPIAGATVTVFAVDNATGQPVNSIGANGQLGQCMATDATGTVACKLNTENYQGPIQVAASGIGLSYTDPSDGVTVISIPQTFQFTSFIGNYKTGTAISVPLSLWTTLDDIVALAYLQGVDRAVPTPHSLTDSLLAIDPLFERHVTPTSWDVRGTVPVALTTTAQSLRDVVYAALPDVALNQIARDKSALANVTPGGVITAVTLLQLLERDAVADGQFDGVSGTAQLKTPGNPQQALDASWLRYAMAQALDEWFKGPTNKTGLASSDVQNAAVFDTVAGDTSILFPSSVVPPPYDNTPPAVTVAATFTNNGSTSAPVTFAAQHLVAGTLHIAVTASDSSGVQGTSVQYRGSGATSWTQMAANPGSSATNLNGNVDTTSLAEGLLTIAVLSTDKVGNAGTTTVQYVVDNAPPTLSLVQPVAPPGYPKATPAYSSVVPANITVSDNQAVASVAETSLSVTLSNATSTGNWIGSWTIPAAQADGALSFTYKACDVVFNCRTLGAPFLVDRTPPSLSITAIPARYTNQPTVAITATATDGAGSGVSAVYAQNLSTSSAPVAAVYDSGSASWNISGISLKTNSDNTIVVYGKDNALDSSGAASGSNSGFTRDPPYQGTVLSMNDSSPPLISASASQPQSYYDERGMQLLQMSGRPANLTSSWYFDPSPISNSRSTPLLAVDISGATPVHKTAQRIALGTVSPNLADLLGARGSSTNTPYLALTVQYAAAIDAPIVGAAYSATVTCAACPPFAAASGALVQDALNTADGTRYILPLSTEFIPALGQIASQATVIVSAGASDAAGNTHALQQVATVQFALDAPPILAVREDTGFAGGDPWALANFRIADGTYDKSFAAATVFTPTEGHRLTKHIVYNASASVGFTPHLTSDPADPAHGAPTVENWEQWDDVPLNLYPRAYPWCLCRHNFCFSGYPANYWDTPNAPTNSVCPGLIQSSTPYPPAKMSTAPMVLHTYVANDDGVTTAREASVAPNGSYIVPAASPGFMGMLLVFSGRNSGNVIRSNLDQAPGGAVFLWQSDVAKYYAPYLTVPGTAGPSTSSNTEICSTNDWIKGTEVCYQDSSDWRKQLDLAQANLYAALTWSANQFVPNTSSVIGASTPTTSVTLSRVIAQ